MPYCNSKDACEVKVLHVFGWLLIAAVGVVVVASLPELKRYIKISNM
jgi:hypothetical protein